MLNGTSAVLAIEIFDLSWASWIAKKIIPESKKANFSSFYYDKETGKFAGSLTATELANQEAFDPNAGKDIVDKSKFRIGLPIWMYLNNQKNNGVVWVGDSSNLSVQIEDSGIAKGYQKTLANEVSVNLRILKGSTAAKIIPIFDLVYEYVNQNAYAITYYAQDTLIRRGRLSSKSTTKDGASDLIDFTLNIARAITPEEKENSFTLENLLGRPTL